MNTSYLARRRPGQRGFTLIELLLVTVIIGILAGSVVMVFAGGAQDARKNRALQDIRTPENAVERYVLENNDQLPKSLNDVEQYLKEPPKDPWGRPYVYLAPGKYRKDSFDIHSKGPDGIDGNKDDVAPWLEEN